MIKTVLHYSLGFNSERGGGLTKYSDDLIQAQSKQCKVILLYPGELKLFDKKTSIKREKKKYNIENYSIINPLSIPFLSGLKDMRYLTASSSKEIWREFFISIKPDIFHIHTLIGLNRECIEVAKEMNIPMVYTTHDYFGLCPKQTFVYKKDICDNRDNCINCSECNSTGISNKKLYMLHSKLFCKIRNLKILKLMKNHFKESNESIDSVGNESNLDFVALRNEYNRIFSYIDFFHFNSSVAKQVFLESLGRNLPGDIFTITHKGIQDKRQKKYFANDKLRMLYLGPPQNHKGFTFLIDTLDRIYQINPSFELNIYCNSKMERPYLIKCGEGYNYNELGQIFEKIDLLIVPSQWYETFGFIVPEAMSFGVPVLVTQNVGAKDIIINDYNGIIVNNCDFYDTLLQLTREKNKLISINEAICKSDFYTFDMHIKTIFDMYDKLSK